MNNYAIILAAGYGKRLNLNYPKAFVKYKNREIYKYSLSKFLDVNKFKKIILVVPKIYVNKIKNNLKKIIVIAGGNTRNESFELGLATIINEVHMNDKILVHDAARINIKTKDIKRILESKLLFGTLAYVGKKNNVDLHLLNKYNVQTPQFFIFWTYLFCNSNNNGKDLLTYLDYKYENKNFLISSNKEKNYKITYINDLKK